MDTDKITKLPRLYTENPLKRQEPIPLTSGQAHYLKNVMRRSEGDSVRLFNGKDGEYLATITSISKKNAILTPQDEITAQPTLNHRTHLLFAPLAKNRLDFVIEKSVELGVTDLHPIITARTEHRKINKDRITAQIIEASEQCERMHIPTLHDLAALNTAIPKWQHTDTIQWACERDTAKRKPLGYNTSNDQAFLIGPVGGFDQAEHDYLQTLKHITPISLGSTILRAETASILCLSQIAIHRI